ncbi:MAG: hypothetical protein MR639_14675 [Clostridium sp.]|uniref:hypothetical protein n=1 Tax=Clostridium sp. TaxID=1506 RepID=UPI002A8E8828|nr:hypothetical protein [Clostridium sp.]MDY5097829.1 hypothetical protein [Clostridium sp.]
MIILLYIGFITGFIVAWIMFHKQTRNIHKRTDNEVKIRTKLTKFIIVDLVLAFLIMITISFIIPYGIWLVGKKDFREVEMIVQENSLVPFEDGTYVKDESTDNGEIYVVNEKGNGKSKGYERYYSKEKNIQFIEDKKNAKYEEINIYKIKCLKNSNPINKMVNDMFANVYMENRDGEFVEKVIKIYTP